MTEIVYSSDRELRRPRLFLARACSDLRRSGGIARRLFRSNLRVRFRRSGLGYAWLLLPSLGTAAVCAFIQARRIVALPPTELPYPLYVLSGVVLWQVFTEALNAPMQQIQAGRQLATRSRVPHEALILAGAFEVLLNASIRLAVLAAALVLFGVAPAGSALLIPLGVVALAVLGLAAGLLLAPAGLLYDDVGRAVALATSFGFFLTPVAYPLPADGLLRLNPVAPLLQTTRGWLVGARPADGFLVVAVAAVAMALAGWLFYRIAKPHLIAGLG